MATASRSWMKQAHVLDNDDVLAVAVDAVLARHQGRLW